MKKISILIVLVLILVLQLSGFAGNPDSSKMTLEELEAKMKKCMAMMAEKKGSESDMAKCEKLMKKMKEISSTMEGSAAEEEEGSAAEFEEEGS